MYLLKRYFKTRISAVMSGSENKESAEQSLKAWEANVDLTKLNEKQKRIHAEHLKAIKVYSISVWDGQTQPPQ